MTLVFVGSLMLAAVLATAGVAKLRDRPGSREAIAGFGVPASLVAPLGLVVPIAELFAAVALVAAPVRTWGALGALILLVGFSLAITWNLARGRTPDCHCFGQLHSSPAGPRTLARNAALITLAGLVASQADPPATALAASVGVAIAAAGWALSRRSALARSGEAPAGLRVGSIAPSFELPALEGDSVSLESVLRPGKPALLVFSDPHCGPCQALAPDIAEWQRVHSDELTVAVIERRDGATPGGRDEHGRRTVLLQSETEVSDAYGAQGTPTAVLVGPDGRVASPLAGGSVEIQALVAERVKRFKPHPVEREGGSVWTVPFRLGGPVARRELLVRGAGASAAASTVLGLPARALGMRRGRGAPRCDRDRDCPLGTVCRGGRCDCGGGFAPDRCAGDCINFDIHSEHCGGCRRPCPSGTTCYGGRCIRGDGTCSEDCTGSDICCRGGCVNPAGEQNCGGCGIRCGSGQTCCAGRCVDPRRDPRYCGGCIRGKKCGPKQVCHNGRCRDECPKPLRQCGRTCGNPNSQKCCGKKVVIDKEDIANGTLKCCDGKALEPTSSGGCPECGSDADCTGPCAMCCDGECTAPSSQNCGGCGRVCPAEGGCQCGVVNGKLGCYNTTTPGPDGGICPDGDAGFVGSPASCT